MGLSMMKRKNTSQMKSHLIRGFRSEFRREFKKAMNDPKFVRTSGKILNNLLRKYGLKEIKDTTNIDKIRAGWQAWAAVIGLATVFIVTMKAVKSRRKKLRTKDAFHLKETAYRKKTESRIKKGEKSRQEFEKLKQSKDPVIKEFMGNKYNQGFVQSFLEVKNGMYREFSGSLKIKAKRTPKEIKTALSGISKNVKITLRSMVNKGSEKTVKYDVKRLK